MDEQGSVYGAWREQQEAPPGDSGGGDAVAAGSAVDRALTEMADAFAQDRPVSPEAFAHVEYGNEVHMRELGRRVCARLSTRTNT